MDHLGPPLPLRLSLLGHGSLHPGGQFYVLDLYHRHKDESYYDSSRIYRTSLHEQSKFFWWLYWRIKATPLQEKNRKPW
jgi:hypothetical protein